MFSISRDVDPTVNNLEMELAPAQGHRKYAAEQVVIYSEQESHASGHAERPLPVW